MSLTKIGAVKYQINNLLSIVKFYTGNIDISIQELFCKSTITIPSF